MTESDPMAMMHQAMNEAYRRVIEMTHETERKIATRPALPESLEEDEVFAEKPEPKAAQRQAYLAIRSDPQRLMAELTERARRLPPDKPIPRDFLETLVEGEKLIAPDLEAIRHELEE